MSKAYGAMANRVNKGGQSLGPKDLVGKISQVGNSTPIRKMSDEHDDHCIDKFKRQQSNIIARVCPTFGAAYHALRDEHSLDKGGN